MNHDQQSQGLQRKLRQVWPPVAAKPPHQLNQSDTKLKKVRAAMRWYSARSQLFGPMAFDEPSWQVMVRVYAAQLEGSEATILSVLRSIPAPDTVIARCVSTLEQADLLVRVRTDPSGEEKLRLTDVGLGGMHALFEALPPRVFS